MIKKIRCPGSATIINAIATGFGSAFGIGLDIKCEAKTINEGIECSNDVGASTDLMDLCVSKVFEKYDVDVNDFGLKISTQSSLPMASGLSSSSASSNAIVAITSKIISEEFDFKPLADMEIINLAIDASIEAGVTITGSFDDATASYFGGVVVTDNKNREFIIREKMDDYKILVYMPNFHSKSGDSDVNRMRVMAPLVETAFDFAKSRDYFKALNLNGLIYASALGFDPAIAVDALQSGAIASGLSGTGSSFVAVCDESSCDSIMDAWGALEGNVIETNVDNDGCLFL
ncbi:MAG: shikimate kinase [Methanobrevibacter sp.]|nr:shikimate kinase [Methanobrevibacter sp.]